MTKSLGQLMFETQAQQFGMSKRQIEKALEKRMEEQGQEKKQQQENKQIGRVTSRQAGASPAHPQGSNTDYQKTKVQEEDSK